MSAVRIQTAKMRAVAARLNLRASITAGLHIWHQLASRDGTQRPHTNSYTRGRSARHGSGDQQKLRTSSGTRLRADILEIQISCRRALGSCECVNVVESPPHHGYRAGSKNSAAGWGVGSEQSYNTQRSLPFQRLKVHESIKIIMQYAWNEQTNCRKMHAMSKN